MSYKKLLAFIGIISIFSINTTLGYNIENINFGKLADDSYGPAVDFSILIDNYEDLDISNPEIKDTTRENYDKNDNSVEIINKDSLSEKALKKYFGEKKYNKLLDANKIGILGSITKDSGISYLKEYSNSQVSIKNNRLSHIKRGFRINTKDIKNNKISFDLIDIDKNYFFQYAWVIKDGIPPKLAIHGSMFDLIDLEISYDYIKDGVVIKNIKADINIETKPKFVKNTYIDKGVNKTFYAILPYRNINISNIDKSIADSIRVNINYKAVEESYGRESIKVK